MTDWTQIEAKLNAEFGAGRWHCDDIADNPETPAPVRAFIDFQRQPAFEKYRGLDGQKPPALFASYQGKRVRAVMASRFGDVGITEDLKAETGYSERVYLPQLSDLSDKP